MSKKNYSKSKYKPKNSLPPSKVKITSNLIYGLHAATEALKNPDRNIRQIYVTDKLWYGDTRAKTKGFVETLDLTNLPEPQIVDKAELDQKLGKHTVHQGIALDVADLEEVFLSDFIVKSKMRDKSVLIMLDQVTDPHNVGAILRSAAAFGVIGIIGQTRHMPDLNATACKIACGGAEHVPITRVVNLSDALKKLRDAGFTCIGLDEHTDTPLKDVPKSNKTVIVLGAEGKGLRPKITETCTHIAKLPTQPPIESLNVSNAAAIALYDVCGLV